MEGLGGGVKSYVPGDRACPQALFEAGSGVVQQSALREFHREIGHNGQS